MNILDQIKDANDRKFDDVKALQDTSRQTVMYGAGSYALDVTLFLKRHDVTIAAYCIDEAYLKTGQMIDGQPIQGVEATIKQYPDCNVVIGFADYLKARASLAALGITERVYFIDAPNQYGFFDYQYIVDHAPEFQATYDMLADQKSKDIFVAFINAKLSGNPEGLYDYADFNQYFSDPVVLTDKETFVDSGAYDGDTIASFLKNTNGAYHKIYAFEPDPKNFTKLQQYVSDQSLDNVVLTKAGCWSSTTTLNFSSDANMAAIGAAEADITIDAVTIDDTVGDDAVTYIKMDIEGAELDALKGAQETIKRDHPKLAICAYHKPDDLIVLPQFIQSLSPDYTYYLRHHQYMSWEMVLYAL